MSQGENKGKQGRKAKTQGISHHPTPWCEIRTTLPLCAKSLLWAFCKSMLLVPTQNLSAKMHRNANIVRNSHNTIPLVQNSHHHIHLCEIRTTPIWATIGHISITSRSSFHTYYISFQILGSQESIDLNGAQFGVETKKLWPFEDDCAKLNGNVAAAPHFATFGALSGAQIMHIICLFES